MIQWNQCDNKLCQLVIMLVRVLGPNTGNINLTCSRVVGLPTHHTRIPRASELPLLSNRASQHTDVVYPVCRPEHLNRRHKHRVNSEMQQKPPI